MKALACVIALPFAMIFDLAMCLSLVGLVLLLALEKSATFEVLRILGES